MKPLYQWFKVEKFKTDAITGWSTVIEYLCHRWSMICSNCCNHNPYFYLDSDIKRIIARNVLAWATPWYQQTYKELHAYPSGTHDVTLVFVVLVLFNIYFFRYIFYSILSTFNRFSYLRWLCQLLWKRQVLNVHLGSSFSLFELKNQKH